MRAETALVFVALPLLLLLLPVPLLSSLILVEPAVVALAAFLGIVCVLFFSNVTLRMHVYVDVV
jgi:hypothetical protein